MHARQRRFPSLSTTSLTYVFALLGAGLLFLILAFTLFLPVVMLAPSKFAVCFTIGSLLLMSAFLSLRGWKSQLSHMFSAERLPFSAGAPSSCMQNKPSAAACLACSSLALPPLPQALTLACKGC